MRLLILGATGKTGRLLVRQALDRGHTVTAFARHPADVTAQHPQLRVAQGDILDRESIDAAVQNQDAVLSALGVETLRANTILSDGTRNVIAAMQRHGPRRLIVISSLGVGESAGQLGWLYNRLLIPLLLRNIFADKELQERYIVRSDLDWTIVRPGALSNGARTGHYQHGFSPNDRSIRARIARADVADFMLALLDDPASIHQAIGVSY